VVDGAKKVTLDTPNSQSQHLRNLLGGPFLQVTQDKDFLLARGERAKGTPDTPLFFSAEHLFFWCQSLSGESPILEFFAALSPPLPPARAPAITTGVHGDSCQPCPPCYGPVLGLELAEKLEKNFLPNLLSLLGINQQQATQAHDPRILRSVKLIVVRLLVCCSHALRPLHISPE